VVGRREPVAHEADVSGTQECTLLYGVKVRVRLRVRLRLRLRLRLTLRLRLRLRVS